MGTLTYHKKKDQLEYSRITPQIYIGTNQCCQTHFAEELLGRGVRADLSLEEKRLDAPFGVKYYLWLPTKDHSPPSPRQLEVGIAFINKIIGLGEKIYVHCKNGHGRAPTLVAAYFIVHRNMTPTEAFRFIKKRRRSIHLRQSQKKALQKFYRKTRGLNY